MAKKLFGTDRIRGNANVFPMTPDVVLKVGQALGHLLRGKSKPGAKTMVLIGKDTRLSGYMVEQALAKASSELEMLTAIVSGLKIQDATETTRIIEGISTLFAQLNQVRSVLRNRRNDLAKTEGAAQFQAPGSEPRYARMSFSTRPCTSVSRKSRPP